MPDGKTVRRQHSLRKEMPKWIENENILKFEF